MPFLNVLRQIGTPVERRLDESHIPSDLLGDPESLLPLAHLLTFLTRNARAEGVEDLGLRAAAQSHISGLGLFGQILMQSASLAIALDKVSRLIPLYSSGQRIWINTWQGQARICHNLPRIAGEGRRYANQFTMLMIIDLMRQAAGPKWQPAEIHLERGVDDPRPYESLGVRLRESECAAIVCDHHLLARPLLTSPHSDSRSEDVAKLALGAPPDNFVESIRQVIATYMRNDMIGVDHIAGSDRAWLAHFAAALARAGDGLFGTCRGDAARLGAKVARRPGDRGDRHRPGTRLFGCRQFYACFSQMDGPRAIRLSRGIVRRELNTPSPRKGGEKGD